MVRAYIVYACLWVIAGALTLIAAILLKQWQRVGRSLLLWRLGGSVACVVAAALLIVDLNVLPTWLHQAALLRTSSAARDPACPLPLRPTSIIDPVNGNEPFSPRPCAVEWVANVDAPSPIKPPTNARDCLSVRRGARPAVECIASRRSSSTSRVKWSTRPKPSR